MGGNASADLHKAANSGRCGVKDVHVVLLNDVPPSSPVWRIRSTFVNHLGSTVRQWSVHNVGVTGDPTDIRGAPVNILTFVQVKNILVSVSSLG